MMELIFHRRGGLEKEELSLLDLTCWNRIVCLEEWFGKKQCVVTSHDTLHIKDDVLRFGHPDNFWCFHSERAV